MAERTNKIRIPVLNIVIGVVGSMVSALLLSMIAAWLIGDGRVGENISGIMATIIIALSSLIGAVISAFATERMPVVPILTSASFCILLLSTGALFFDGKYNGILQGFIAALSCGAVVCATCMKKPRRNGYKKLRSR